MYILRMKKGRHICIDNKVRIMVKKTNRNGTVLAISCPKEIKIDKSTIDEEIKFEFDNNPQLTKKGE